MKRKEGFKRIETERTYRNPLNVPVNKEYLSSVHRNKKTSYLPFDTVVPWDHQVHSISTIPTVLLTPFVFYVLDLLLFRQQGRFEEFCTKKQKEKYIRGVDGGGGEKWVYLGIRKVFSLRLLHRKRNSEISFRNRGITDE